MENLRRVAPEIYEAIVREIERQDNKLELIASENFVSLAVLEAMGYPGRRYYGSCENVDVAEYLAQERAKKLFGAEYANVQPHSGFDFNRVRINCSL